MEVDSGLLVPKDKATVVKGLLLLPIQNMREAVSLLECEFRITPRPVLF
jgi:hypothetical protein